LYEERKSNCSARIADALSIRNMKQSELSEKTNIPKSAISQYISGAFEPKQDRIYIIAKALNVSEAWLMGYDVPMERQKSIPDEKTLTEEEREWLDLFRRIPKTSQPLARLLLDSVSQLPEERQQMALEMVRIALKK
jgi:transcriptional regulator with XRE-family HTH domain